MTPTLPYPPPHAARAIARSVRPVRWTRWWKSPDSDWWTIVELAARYPRADRPIAAWRAW